MRVYYMFIVFLVLGLTTACQEKIVTTESGTTYQILEEGEGKPVEDGLVMESWVSFQVITDGEVVQKRDATQPNYNKMVFAQAIQNPIMSIMKDRKVGDSLMIEMPFNEKTKEFMPRTAKESTVVKYFVKVTNVETEEENRERRTREMQEEQERMMKQMEEQKPIDDAAIKKYVEENNLENVERLESGLYYMITEGKGAAKPAVGDNVSVHYTGTLLSDGSKFDSSLDRGTPFQFPLGMNRVIRGWDEGIALLGKGDKATLLIPSHLGYGPRGSGEKIPPFSILKFDVELLDFEKAPEKAPVPQK